MNKLDYSPKCLNCSSKIQLLEVFLKESCFLKFRNIHRKKPVLESLKVACFQTCNVIKKRLQHRCFHVNFAKFVRTPFLQSNSGRLFLKYMNISQSDIATSPSGAFLGCENVAFFNKINVKSRTLNPIIHSFRKMLRLIFWLVQFGKCLFQVVPIFWNHRNIDVGYFSSYSFCFLGKNSFYKAVIKNAVWDGFFVQFKGDKKFLNIKSSNI